MKIITLIKGMFVSCVCVCVCNYYSFILYDERVIKEIEECGMSGVVKRDFEAT